MSGVRQTFQLSPEQLTIRDILSNKSFVEIEIWAISNADPNRNKSCFTVESMRKGLDTFVNKPILGFFNKEGDFEQHNAKVNYDPELGKPYWDNTDGEQILGFIRKEDQKEIVEKDGLMWIRCTAMIYTQYNFKQVKRLLKDKSKKVSVEVNVLDSEMINGVQYIRDFELNGITILGSKGGIPILEGIAGAHLSVLDLMGKEPLHQQQQALVFAYADLSKKEDGELANSTEPKVTFAVNKSMAAVSETEWSKVDFAALRQRVVEDADFAAVAGDVFLCMGEGWESDVSKLKYPVMQFAENGELVYNREGLALAKAYAAKNDNTEVLDKLQAIYAELGLNFEAEQCCDGADCCNLYEDEKKPDDKGDDKHDDDKPDNGDGEGEGDPAKKDDDETPNVHADCDAKYAELYKKYEACVAECDGYKARCEAYEKQCGEYEEKCTSLNNQLTECNNRYSEATKTLEIYQEQEKVRIVEAQMSHIVTMTAQMGLTEDDVKDVTAKCQARQFAAVDEIDKEMAYLSFKKNYTATEVQPTKAEYSVNIVDTSTPVKSQENLTVGERLKRNINKN